MKPGRPPGIFNGALTGAFLTAPLIAIFYPAWKLFGLPLVPFSIFDWVSRVLPERKRQLADTPLPNADYLTAKKRFDGLLST